MEFHIRCEPEDIARYVFVPGSHTRAQKIADNFDEARLVSDSRGYLVYTGTVDGIPMTVSSTGMGGPQTAICIEELAHMGVDTFIRVGSCGTFQEYVSCGDVVISTGIFRAGGTANNYLPVEFPAVPTFEVTTALVTAAKELGLEPHVGLGGVISVEMESDTLFVIAALRGWRAGALFTCDGTATETKPEWGDAAFEQGQEDAIRIAIEAMKNIALADSAGEE